MTTKTQIEQQLKKQPKIAYHPPKLITYGDVRKLTQTGTSGVAEAGSQSGNKLKP